MSNPLRVAVVGAGPAGIYASDILTQSGLDVSIDLIERNPAPFGLVRYGVAPDHPWIKAIIDALVKILQRGDMRLITNVDFGTDLTLADLRDHYDAIIFATGAIKDAELPIPGVDLPGSYGAADFVSWYDGHPDVPRSWPLEAREVAVLGAGNVALDVTRILIKRIDELIHTDIPPNVVEGISANQATDVHVFARRGPAQLKFTPVELRELGRIPGVDVIVYPEDFEFDDGSYEEMASSNRVKQVVEALTDWKQDDPAQKTAERRIHLHMLHRPVEILGEDQVEGVRTERTKLTGDGTVTGTGEFFDWPVQAVYRAVGYFGSALPGLPFDETHGVISNVEGRVIDDEGVSIPGLYTTGWIKRGPVGLIGHTKSDAQETIRHLVADADGLLRAPQRDPQAILDLLKERGVEYGEWAGYLRLDAHERSLGEAEGRDRIKVVPRDELMEIISGRSQ